MSIQEVTMYRVVCDEPGCEASAQDGSDYYAWAHSDAGPYEDAADADWQVTPDGDYCPDHRGDGDDE